MNTDFIKCSPIWVLAPPYPPSSYLSIFEYNSKVTDVVAWKVDHSARTRDQYSSGGKLIQVSPVLTVWHENGAQVRTFNVREANVKLGVNDRFKEIIHRSHDSVIVTFDNEWNLHEM